MLTLINSSLLWNRFQFHKLIQTYKHDKPDPQEKSFLVSCLVVKRESNDARLGVRPSDERACHKGDAALLVVVDDYTRWLRRLLVTPTPVARADVRSSADVGKHQANARLAGGIGVVECDTALQIILRCDHDSYIAALAGDSHTSKRVRNSFQQLIVHNGASKRKNLTRRMVM